MEEAELHSLSCFLGLVDKLELQSFYTDRMAGLKCSLGVLEILLQNFLSDLDVFLD